ncbi:MAG: threonine synthase [Firmicutes bacterium]|nr:threonine synthase [Bacillota bacterium]
MLYISTRDSQASPVSGAQAILRGLAADGGLYSPQAAGENGENVFPCYFPANLAQKSYAEVAQDIFALYLPEFTTAEITDAITKAYANGSFPSAVAPIVQVGPFTVLELFHGPTCAFKDMALAVLPHLMSLSAAKMKTSTETVILVATSGDTGKAAQEGFAKAKGYQVIVFYPAGGVSEMQEKQMRSGGGSSTFAVAIRGNFDDCQNGVKAIFANASLRERLQKADKCFSSANSINFGRLLPQIVYYYYAYAQMLKQGRIQFSQSIDIAVPTGNFGNILAAYYALRMGLPLRRLICASNENDVLKEALATGLYNSRRPFYKTASPSMDILVSSNFERFLFEMYGRNGALLAADLRQFAVLGCLQIGKEHQQNWQNLLYGGSAAWNKAAPTIARVLAEYDYLLDPHTAVGFTVASDYFDPAENVPLLLIATASPYKFPAAVLEALGIPASGLNSEQQLERLSLRSKVAIPKPLAELTQLTLRPRQEIEPRHMEQAVIELLQII